MNKALKIIKTILTTAEEKGDDVINVDITIPQLWSLEEALQSMQWRPISTAPKDDQTFLVYCQSADDPMNCYEIYSTWGLHNAPQIGDMVPMYWMPLPPAPQGDE